MGSLDSIEIDSIEMDSIVIGAAHVVAAFFADELALSPRQTRRTDRAIEHGLIFVLRRRRLFWFLGLHE
jgi:hypothetical protein